MTMAIWHITIHFVMEGHISASAESHYRRGAVAALSPSCQVCLASSARAISAPRKPCLLQRTPPRFQSANSQPPPQSAPLRHRHVKRKVWNSTPTISVSKVSFSHFTHDTLALLHLLSVIGWDREEVGR